MDKHNEDDTIKSKLLMKLSVEYENFDVQESINYAYQALHISKKHNNYFKVGQILTNIGNLYLSAGNYQKALECGIERIKLSDKISDVKQKKENTSYGLSLMSNVYNYLGDYDKALDCSKKSLQLEKELLHQEHIAYALLSMGNTFVYKSQQASGNVKYQNLGSALSNYKLALEEVKQLPNMEYELSLCYNNIGNVYMYKSDYNSALSYFFESLKIAESTTNQEHLIICYDNIGECYMNVRQYKKAIEYFNKGVQILKEIHSSAYLNTLYNNLSVTYEKMGQLNEALYYAREEKKAQDSLMSIEKSKNIQELSVKYETELKDAENKLLRSQSERQKIIMGAIFIGLCMMSVIAFIIFRGYKQKQKINQILSEQKKIIENKNKDITDSINYAKRIQDSLLLPEGYLNQYIPNHFILFKPRDIVSGDFYWAAKKDNLLFLAVCDSTGHGVPGAFMSLLNMSFLNEAINQENILEPHKIFNYVRERLKSSFIHQGTQDGMDGVLLRFHINDNKILKIDYAAANNSPYIHQNKQCVALPYDKMPIGISEMSDSFNLFHINLDKETAIYITSDGLVDQFGGDKNKRLTSKRFKEIVQQNSSIDIFLQKNAFEENLKAWQKENEQTDDILLIGLQV